MLKLEGPAWTFALEFYRRPGVAPACLTLQDQAGVDVIHLILVLYAHAVLDRPLSVETIAEARDVMADWREATVQPIRAVQRAMKHADTAFPGEQEIIRTRIKDAELQAEQVQLALAEHWLHNQPATEGLTLESALQAVVVCYDDYLQRDRREVEAALHSIVGAAEQMQGLHEP